MFAARKRKDKAKAGKRKRNADDGEEEQEQQEEDAVIAPVMTDRRKLNMFSTGGSKRPKEDVVAARQIESEREIVPHSYAGDATYESRIDTETDRDARAIMERNIKANQDGTAETESGRVYRGQASYKNYIAKQESQIGMNKYTGTQGPIRAQTWARSICRFDYQPDICKDYKETGFCGYGDSCKFLHDRGDYKSGWQMEQEHAEKDKQRQRRLAEGLDVGEQEDDDDKYVIHSEDEDEQFACTICRQPFHNAVETLCGHFFCEQCALKHFKKSSRCFNCKKQTNGVFQAADKLRERERERIQAEQEGYGDEDEESS